MGPIAQADGHDAQRLVDETVPCVSAVIDDVVIGFEDAVRQQVVAHELPDVFRRIEFWGARRQSDEGDVGRNDEFRREMPSGAIEDENGVRAGVDFHADRFKMQVHRFGVAPGQNEARALAFCGADRAENVCP